MRHHVRRIVREQFNVDVMVDRFVAAARAAVGGRAPAAT
jgi:hypothetical protein